MRARLALPLHCVPHFVDADDEVSLSAEGAGALEEGQPGDEQRGDSVLDESNGLLESMAAGSSFVRSDQACDQSEELPPELMHFNRQSGNSDMFDDTCNQNTVKDSSLALQLADAHREIQGTLWFCF